jgi:hypothetical protein
MGEHLQPFVGDGRELIKGENWEQLKLALALLPPLQRPMNGKLLAPSGLGPRRSPPASFTEAGLFGGGEGVSRLTTPCAPPEPVGCWAAARSSPSPARKTVRVRRRAIFAHRRVWRMARAGFTIKPHLITLIVREETIIFSPFVRRRHWLPDLTRTSSTLP